ncbi:MAG: phosphatase PAP2 family protein [Candidatus Kapaibacteriales bacterium]
MIDFLYSLDLALFYFFNHSISHPILDKIFVIITTQECWYITYALLLFFMLTKFGAKGRYFVLLIILGIFLSDQISSHLIKEWVNRIRPCHSLEDVRLLVPCGSGKSFPSSHAINNFSLAIFLSYFFKKYKIHFFILASLVALSRVYVGVHYPSDIIAGTIIGYLFGNLVIIIYKRFENLLAKRKVEQ